MTFDRARTFNDNRCRNEKGARSKTEHPAAHLAVKLLLCTAGIFRCLNGRRIVMRPSGESAVERISGLKNPRSAYEAGGRKSATAVTCEFVIVVFMSQTLPSGRDGCVADVQST